MGVNLNAKLLIKEIQKLEEKHRELAEGSEYEAGFADGLQQAINEISKELDRSKGL